MTKRQLVDEIIQRNATASPTFLAGFSEKDLAEYLEHLNWLSQPAPSPALSGGMTAQAVVAQAEPVVEIDQRPLRPSLQIVVAEPAEEEEPAEVAAYNTQEDANLAVVAVASGSESEEPLPFAQESERTEESWLF
jgi:hypothetical protein